MSASNSIDWFWLALRWWGTLNFAWGRRSICPSKFSSSEQEGLGCRPLSLVAVEPPEVWAESARLIEIDARERGDQDLIALAVDVGQHISRFYEMAYDGQNVDGWRDKVNEMFGFYHAYARHRAHCAWAIGSRDHDGNDDSLVWLVERHIDEVGMWLLLARLLAARAIQVAGRWHRENTDAAIKLGIDKFDLAPHLLAIGLEDSHGRIIRVSVKKAEVSHDA